ncbi:PREDICTED: E3 ubiquitin-protein ligase MIB1-like [Nicrophorus vespilloides]|uniref:E3 ubiquitin-protein ligase MIB1-like n=1 Tax=Nicrophorus vespilloides TaxID=110193 RepID=A0ABM1MKT9_NICVS|nr:PREDICTED: E3 ubiquitin-protein ligase MIB1-like [Nicrophorus vespilloides]
MTTSRIKVIRGPNWKWGNQDGGKGTIGTVLEEFSDTQNVVVVKWDNGICSNYRAGYDKMYDLRIIDNSQITTLKQDVPCNCCNTDNIIGMKYQCNSCELYNLCFTCYHTEKHNIDHPFILFTTKTSSGVILSSRISSKQIIHRSGSKYYYRHLPVLGKHYKQILKTTPSIMWNVEDVTVCVGCDKPSSENIIFKPCNHKVACTDCSEMFENCMICRASIKKRVTPNDIVLPNINENRLQKLENMLYQIEDNFYCRICTANIANVLFNCGHCSCTNCSERLEVCHMCRKLITKKMKSL